ncbi:MAG: class I SAM-dependent methyltransferase [bacterium]|nr:class I SAM-dependent methyltransferase [bacterium]
MRLEQGQITVLKQEQAIIENSYSSLKDFIQVSFAIDFPKDISGKRILGVGEGLSEATLRLREMGAEAWAIDPKYADMKALRKGLEEDLTIFRTWLLGDQSMTDSEKYIIMRRNTNTVDSFFSPNDNANRQYHIAASACFLPFADRTFDLYFSSYAVSSFLLPSDVVFRQAIDEGLRVLRPGGELQLYPWVPNEKGDHPEERATQERLFENLQSRSIAFAVEPTSYTTPPRLKITLP